MQATGPAGVRALLDAARSFPGGPAVLVFALFWSPVGPGIPAGVLLARHIPLSPPITFALYAASDLLGALVCYPLFTALRRHASRVRPLHWIGTRMLRLAMLGTRAPRVAEVQVELGRRRVGLALFRIATVGFGVDVYSAGMVATGLPVPGCSVGDRRSPATSSGSRCCSARAWRRALRSTTIASWRWWCWSPCS
jgi:hypothetical protein